MNKKIYQQELSEWLGLLRSQTLEGFVRDLLPALKENGYEIEDLIEAIASHSSTRPDWQKACKHLLSARDEIKKARREIITGDRSLSDQ